MRNNKKIDIPIGTKFNKLTVIEESSQKPLQQNGTIKQGTAYKCLCDCDNTIIVNASYLISGTYKTCGCLKTGGHNVINLTGKRFGKLAVIKKVKPPMHLKSRGDTFWECLCDCGNKTIVRGYSLRNKTKSCGCLKILPPCFNLTGQRFGKLVVIKREGSAKQGSALWRCECDCGGETITQSTYLRNGATKSCGCLKKATGKNNAQWKGYGEIYSNYWTNLIRSAKRRNLQFEITQKIVWEKFIQQKGECALSGILLKHYPSRTKNKGPDSASLDRIDSTKGYIQGNIQWVSVEINKIKMELSNERFIKLCKQVARYQNEVEAFVTNKVTSLGIESLREQFPQIENEKGDTDGMD